MLIIKGVIWLAKKINEVAENEFSGRGSIKEKLMEVLSYWISGVKKLMKEW